MQNRHKLRAVFVRRAPERRACGAAWVRSSKSAATSGHSPILVPAKFDLEWLCAQPFVATEMKRRRILRRARSVEQVEVPAHLSVGAEDHLNAEIWCAGLVPGTWLGEAAKAG